jgi:C4-dicarboxylate transporter DctM subunit
MSHFEIGIIGFLVSFILIFLGLPIGVSMGIVGLAGIAVMVNMGAAVGKAGLFPLGVLMSFDYAVIPLFILMANVLFNSGISADLYRTAFKWVGRVKGGLGMATVVACAIFAACSGSSVAAAATIGAAALPEMKKYKYDPGLATGCIAAGGTIGILIPPSIVLILYGIITENSIGLLFMAGLIPGILEAVFYIITIYVLCRWKPQLASTAPSFTFREKVTGMRDLGGIIVVIGFVLGGLFVGWFTPTEAGAIGAFMAILVSVIARRMSWPRFKDSLVDTLKTSGMLYCILIGAFFLMAFISMSGVATSLSEHVLDLQVSPNAIAWVVIFVYIVLGCIMDAPAMMLITMPIFYPLMVRLGFDPIWFGIIVVRVMEIALITPPIGMNVYVIAGIAPDVPIQTIFKGIIPFLIADVLHVCLLFFVPAIVLFLPSILV